MSRALALIVQAANSRRPARPPRHKRAAGDAILRPNGRQMIFSCNTRALPAPFSENPRLFASRVLNCRQFVNFARQVAKTCVQFTPIDGPTLSGSSSFRSDAAPVRGACVSGSKAPLRKRGNEKAGFRRNRPFSFCTPRPCAGGHEKRRGPRRFFDFRIRFRVRLGSRSQSASDAGAVRALRAAMR